MTDYLSRYVEYSTVPAHTTNVVIKALLIRVLARHGIRSISIVDQGSCFTSHEFLEFCSRFHINKQYTDSHHSTGVTSSNVSGTRVL